MFIYIPPYVYLLISTRVCIKVCIFLNTILILYWVFKFNRWTYWKKNIKYQWYVCICVCVYIYTHTHTHVSTCSVTSVLSYCLQLYGFPKQKHWSGLPCPPPGDLPDSGIEPMSPACPELQMDPLSHLGCTPPPHFHLTSDYWVLTMSHIFQALRINMVTSILQRL